MKKLKSLWISLIIVALSVAMIIGSMSISAFAADPVVDGEKIYSELEYGKTYTLTGADVTYPNGATDNDGEFVADQLGAYKISYGSYSYTVVCVDKNEYELRVAYGGAGIPTRVKSSETDVILPAAELFAKAQDDDEWSKVDSANVAFTVEINGAPVSAETDGTYKTKFNSVGSFDVVYKAQIKGGKQYVSKSFTVKAQKNFADTKKPTLSVSNVPSEISLNTKVNLPVATATDDYDENVKVEVKVEYFTGTDYVAVKEVEVDDNGYASEKADAKDMAFDNVYTTSFYPVKATNHRITYTAIDDSGNAAAQSSYIVKCYDKTAPVLDELAIEDIPTYVSDSDSEEITFPYPKFIDNSNGEIKVEFYITDVTNGVTVIRFDNIFDTENGGNKYVYNESKASQGLGIFNNEELTFTNAGLTLPIGSYVKQIADGDDYDNAVGSYTVYYRAVDEKNNVTRKSYTFTVEAGFEDETDPTINLEVTDEYLLVYENETEYVIPVPSAHDDKDQNVKVQYTLSSNSQEIAVKGGETAKLVKEEGALKLIVDDQTLTLVDDLTFTAKSTDDSGNESTEVTKSVNVIDVSTLSLEQAVTTVDVTSWTDDQTVDASEKATLGEFKITLSDASLRDLVGFEIGIYDANGNVPNVPLNLTTFYDNATQTITVKDVAFTPVIADSTYTVVVRVYNVVGMSRIYTATVNVNPSSSGGDETISAAPTIPGSGNVKTTYKLKNVGVQKPADIDSGALYVVRQIEAKGAFGIMGTEFTAFTAGNFKFTDGYMLESNGGFVPFAENGSYTFTASQTETITTHVLGVMPNVAEKSTDGTSVVVLPAVVGNTSSAEAEIKISGKTPSGKKIEYEVGKSGDYFFDFDSATSEYSFKPLEDGEYVITYTASCGSADEVSQSFTIKVGDVIAPVFTLKSDHVVKAIEGNSFTFKEVVIDTQDTNDYSGKESSFKYVKRLKNPAGTVVYEIEQNGETGRTAVYDDSGESYKFTATGTYTVEYVVTDKVGNDSVYTTTISVSAESTTNPVSVKVISTILIIVAVLLIAGIILYFVRFRKVKKA